MRTDRKLGVRLITVGLAAMATAGTALAQTEWTVASGGNGHFYQPVVVPTGVNWSQANAAATAAGGYLTTLTSATENAFVFGLIDAQSFWNFDAQTNSNMGPWIGLLQAAGSPEPAGGFNWVTAEPFLFSSWDIAGAEPDNSFGIEDAAHFIGRGQVRTPVWNDFASTNLLPPFPGAFVTAYVIEFDGSPSAPEPGTIALLGFGALAAKLVRRRSRR